MKSIGKYVQSKTDLSAALNLMCTSIIKVNLSLDTVGILHHSLRPEEVGLIFPYSEYLKQNAADIGGLYPQFVESLTIRELLRIYNSGKKEENFVFKDREAKISFEQDEESLYAYIALVNLDKNDILTQITNLYVFNNCDYFIYLDIQHNSYIMFSGSTTGTPLPPAYCTDYSSETVTYANHFVVPEDRKMVIREMSIPRIIEELENHQVHTIYCGVEDPNLGYTRKRLEYRYCDDSHHMVLLSRTDITEIYREEQKHHQELQEALERSYTDSLTGILNQQGFMNKVNALLREQSERAALFFLDLDNFKQINDTFGHSTGNKLLKDAAALLTAETRKSDVIGRYGGDEFIVYLHNISSSEAVLERAQRLCSHIRQLADRNIPDVHVSASIGVSFVPEDAHTYDELIEIADRRLYISKNKGKNQVTVRG